MSNREFSFLSRHLEPGERLGELMFGLIMTLTFTLTAGFVVGEERDAVRELLIATIGCNIAWGIIDAGLLVLGRVFERGRYARLRQAISSHPEAALAISAVAEEFDETLEPVTTVDSRRRLYAEIVDAVRKGSPAQPGVRREDWGAALGVFLLVFFASVPAALPFALIDEPWTALRVSNAILIAMVFVIGYKWAGYTSINPWRAAITLTSFGIVMVAAAIALGG